MKYIWDNDLHIHSKLSSCSGDEAQTTARMVEYAKENNLKTICITDHYWDENVEGASNWYKPQDFAHISKALPLPEAEDVRFLFGCETEMDKYFKLGISAESFEKFDFVIIPTTHLHMKNFTIEEGAGVERRAELWVKRLEALLDMNLPWHKIGIAHLACGLIEGSREDYLSVLNLIRDEDITRLMTKAAILGCGIEINLSDMSFAENESDTVLRIFKIAKVCGCKFYFGSDAHHPEKLDEAKAVFERAINLLQLTEDDKFYVK